MSRVNEDRQSLKGTKAVITMWLTGILILSCSVMDDTTIPKDQFTQVEISDFDVNMQKDYIRGKIQNNGEHNITTSIFKFEIYVGSQEVSRRTNLMNESSANKYTGKDSLNPLNLLLSQNFVVRETLKPGYSTEFYYELRMDYEFHDFLYTYEIVQLKGR
ncbi:MAG: hypothetical protein HOD43_04475 [Candidatus Marinimicrobia bacterium]|jgi:hypothetical protein|nr:hypothetical protein [Candidatus Neomarinimicrobiota bacterium]MBT3632186.1 hypothetical protein [Candidatus Neomarinimicrobiota bacterium]MBT3824341.1 hypothetical protein [Candidatus Neomarinimicrobiota bacterium]MBT4130054.1 hypothetical protein [Candidatus Neomarinimicrobiota bacterium]MBT4295041.1 hypothetical protein [Candidatus Neomarinimicrobiota bacterium]